MLFHVRHRRNSVSRSRSSGNETSFCLVRQSIINRDLLAAMARGTKTSPPAESALFVLNKLDQFLEKYGRK